MSPKRAAPKSTTQKQLDQLPLLKKPLEQIGKQIKIPVSFWEGTMTAEEKALEYFCRARFLCYAQVRGRRLRPS